MLLVSSFCTGAFTHRSFYAQKLSHTHTGTFTQRSLYTEELLTQQSAKPPQRGCPPATGSTPRGPLAVASPRLHVPEAGQPEALARAGRIASSRPRWPLWTPCPAPFSQLEPKAIGASAVLVYPAPRWRCCEERGFPL